MHYLIVLCLQILRKVSISKLRLRLGVHKGREWNNNKRMEKKWNGMYFSKGKEWKRMEWNGIK